LGVKTASSKGIAPNTSFSNEKLKSIPPPDRADTLRKFLLEIGDSITILN
jgi:hypothetical protein